MSLIVAGTTFPPQINPTASLLAALRDFDSILSDQQRLIFKGNYTKPDTIDVVAFVSRIDADNKGRARQCVAPRLCSFLECVVQFTGVVDTFVQSNPKIAALVWGGLRTTILAASNYVSYFEKVTDMIMKIGRTSPSFQKFGELYPGSTGLQIALCEYYTTVIRLCIKVIQVSQRSGVVQTLSPVLNPFEADFKSLLETLNQNVKDIDVQIALASHKAARDEDKLAEMERKDNQIHRRIMSRLNDDLRADADELRIQKMARQLAKARMAVSNALGTVDHVPGWRRAKREHLSGTAEWFLQDDQYIKWSASPTTSILWCSGKLGSGKTVSMSNIVVKLLERQNRSGELVSYFFCRTDDSKTLTCRIVLGSVCRQLLDSRLATMDIDELKTFQQQVNGATAQDLVDLTLERLNRGKIYYIVLDGLDEFEPAEIVEVSRVLAQLSEQSDHHFRIVCSARLDLKGSLFKLVKPDYQLSHSGRSVDKDIKTYIAVTLNRCMKEADLVLGDSALFDKIAEALRIGAQGM